MPLLVLDRQSTCHYVPSVLYTDKHGVFRKKIFRLILKVFEVRKRGGEEILCMRDNSFRHS